VPVCSPGAEPVDDGPGVDDEDEAIEADVGTAVDAGGGTFGPKKPPVNG
jgi:hypothetical protein